jgi:hypothetical protein
VSGWLQTAKLLLVVSGTGSLTFLLHALPPAPDQGLFTEAFDCFLEALNPAGMENRDLLWFIVVTQVFSPVLGIWYIEAQKINC